MKKINLSVIICVLSLVCLNSSFSQNPNQGQGNQQWKINGNIADENYYLGTKNEVPIKFRTNDIERFRISPSGDFGIGTSTPESKLDVNGSVILRESLRLVNLNETDFSGKELLLIDGNGNITRGSYQISLNDLSGKNLFSQQANKIVEEINISNLSDGTYRIILKSPRGETKELLILKQAP
jgi:uncharacterized protein YjbI with pentapeptide repeats